MFPYDFPADFPQDMANLTVKLSWTQSSDGKKIIIKDDTNYPELSVSPSGYTRVVELFTGKDATGILLDTLTFIGSDLTVEYTLDEDKYLSAKLTLYGEELPLTDTINFGPTANEYNSLSNILLANKCGCDSGQDQSTRFGFIYLKMAEKAVILGNSGAFNRFIELSRTWLAN